MTEELSETCKVLFQKKFDKLVHLVGFNIRIYHDARSPERQTNNVFASAYSETIAVESSCSLADMPSGTVLVHDIAGKIGLILKS